MVLAAILGCAGLSPLPLVPLGFLLDEPVPPHNSFVGTWGLVALFSLAAAVYTVPIGLVAGLLSGLTGLVLWFVGRPKA